MNHYAIDHIVQDRIADRRRAADAHRLARDARRAGRPPANIFPGSARTGDLAVDLATLGFDRVEHEIARFVRHARSHGVSPVLVAVLADRHAPAVVRQRAFARIAIALDQQIPASRPAA